VTASADSAGPADRPAVPAKFPSEWISSFFEFFDWVYPSSFVTPALPVVHTEILCALVWDDQTVIELLTYVRELQKTVERHTDAPTRQALRARARQIFQRQFEKPEDNRRGRVLWALHNMLEDRFHIGHGGPCHRRGDLRAGAPAGRVPDRRRVRALGGEGP
jgi:hypothetical protein